MSLFRHYSKATRIARSTELCCMCSALQHSSHDTWATTRLLQAPQWTSKSGVASLQRRHYAVQKIDAARMRKDADDRARLGFYGHSRKQAVLHMDPHKANSIYEDFVHHRTKLDHGNNVQTLASKYKVNIEEISSLALVTFKIPDFSDAAKRAALPPSQHKTVSGQILQGCAQAEDPLAIVHILTVVHHSSSSSDPAAREIAALFPRRDLTTYRTTLEKLCANAQKVPLGPDLLTVQALLLWTEGNRQKAQELLTEAVTRSHLKYHPGSKHPMQYPLVTPWNALGFMLKDSQAPEDQALARTYFEMGASQADDPLSCYELSLLEPRTSAEWLKYVSKAAASGHKQAAVDVAEFYQELDHAGFNSLQDGPLSKALNWLAAWKGGSTAALAREWLQVASNAGHKPSSLKLADYEESIGNIAGAEVYLQRLMDTPRFASGTEEWPHLVQLAKRRLAVAR
ncbi:hypothetical protein ACN47E_007291 [Coniothyrium glycines]